MNTPNQCSLTRLPGMSTLLWPSPLGVDQEKVGSYRGLEACACCLSGQRQDVWASRVYLWLWPKAWQKQLKEDSVCSWFQRFQSIIAGRMWWSIIATRKQRRGKGRIPLLARMLLGSICVMVRSTEWAFPSQLTFSGKVHGDTARDGIGCSVS